MEPPRWRRLFRRAAENEDVVKGQGRASEAANGTGGRKSRGVRTARWRLATCSAFSPAMVFDSLAVVSVEVLGHGAVTVG